MRTVTVVVALLVISTIAGAQDTIALKQRLENLEAQIARREAELEKLREQRHELRVKLGLEAPKDKDAEPPKPLKSVEEMLDAVPKIHRPDAKSNESADTLAQWLTLTYSGHPVEMKITPDAALGNGFVAESRASKLGTKCDIKIMVQFSTPDNEQKAAALNAAAGKHALNITGQIGQVKCYWNRLNNKVTGLGVEVTIKNAIIR